MSNEVNIYQRINEVRKAVKYVQKDATVQGYKAVTHDMVTAVLRDALVSHGIVIVPHQRSGVSVEAGQTQKGTPIIRFEADYKIDFVNADKPEEVVSVEMQAHANDTSDKAPGKACSYATKYAMLKVFSLETGENEESRMEGERRNEKAIEHIKEEVQEYIDHGDALAIKLMSASVGQDTWTDIYNSAPDGQKMKFKKQLSELEHTGGEILVAINQALLVEDAGAAAENLQDVTPGGKRLLSKYLGSERASALGALIKTIQKDT